MSTVSHCNFVQSHLHCEQVMHLDMRYLSCAIQKQSACADTCRLRMKRCAGFPQRHFAVRIILSQTKQKTCQSLCTLLLIRSKKMAHQIQCMLGKTSAINRPDDPTAMPTDSGSASLLRFTGVEQAASDLLGTEDTSQTTVDAKAKQA